MLDSTLVKPIPKYLHITMKIEALNDFAEIWNKTAYYLFQVYYIWRIKILRKICFPSGFHEFPLHLTPRQRSGLNDGSDEHLIDIFE